MSTSATRQAKPTIAPVPRLALTIEQTCEALGVSWDTWHEHIAGEIRIVRLGRRQLVPVSEIQRWLDTRSETALERR
jgi:excisionase family DNA binding protein